MKAASSLIEIKIPTAEGEFVARYSRSGLAELRFPTNSMHAEVGGDAACGSQIAAWHNLTKTAVENILAGREAAELPPLDLSGGTDFQRAVWRAMLKIGCGKTKSYGEVAREIGNPKSVRAVGGACGANPIPLLVPCHRVLAASGKIGGFSGGLDWKRRLLAREGIELFA